MEEHTLSFQGSSQRMDVWLSGQLPRFSRARIQDLIKEGLVTVNGAVRKPHALLRPGDQVRVRIPPPVALDVCPQAIALDVLYEDADLIVINKPAGLVVHPAPGHPDGTLVNALLHHCRDLQGIGGELRPGIVHRLDKDTSGVLVAAKQEFTHQALVQQFKLRQVHKQYVAIVRGTLAPRAGTVETLLGRHRSDRKKMSARPLRGRPAVTHYETVKAGAEASLLRIRIETGRTHQIRVHMAFLGHPVLGDRQYGGARAVFPGIDRQMLHAERIQFTHPRTGQPLTLAAPWPPDFQAAAALI